MRPYEVEQNVCRVQADGRKEGPVRGLSAVKACFSLSTLWRRLQDRPAAEEISCAAREIFLMPGAISDFRFEQGARFAISASPSWQSWDHVSIVSRTFSSSSIVEKAIWVIICSLRATSSESSVQRCTMPRWTCPTSLESSLSRLRPGIHDGSRA